MDLEGTLFTIIVVAFFLSAVGTLLYLAFRPENEVAPATPPLPKLHPFLAWLTGPEGEQVRRHLGLHPIRLLFNRMEGVIVAAHSDDETQMVMDMKWIRDQGRWSHWMFAPSACAFIFTDSEGFEKFEGFRAGTMADFEVLKSFAGIQIEHSADLFIPFVSERVVSFEIQKAFLLNGFVGFAEPFDWWRRLVYDRLPMGLKTYWG